MTDLFTSPTDATPLDAAEQRALRPSISTRAELNQFERLNINEARLWALRPRNLRREDLLTDGFSRELHRRMFNRVWRWAGCYRSTERNLGWEVHRLAEGVHNAFADARVWLEHSVHPVTEVAVRLHHRLVVIHPWPNGNGRHARLMADILVAAQGAAELSWGARNDLASPGETRGRYIAALQAADAGDFVPLLEFTRS